MRRGAVFVGVILLALGAMIAVAGRSSEPYRETALRRRAIFAGETIPVNPSSYKAWYYGVSLEEGGLGNKFINGTIRVARGGEINFYVMDRTNYLKWEAGGAATTYVNSTKGSSFVFKFSPDKGGDYFFVIDNKQYQTAKEVYADIAEYWRATETKYRTTYDFRNLIAGVWLGVLGLLLLAVGRGEPRHQILIE